MCDDSAAGTRRLRRRTVVRAGVALGVAAPLLPGLATRAMAAPPADALAGLAIHPRDDWAEGRSATGPLRVEADGDVRFLLVHHSASANVYAAAEVPGLLRDFYAAHTGSKGWPDVAYNFFIDRYGDIWEGRTGSLAAPVIADATGGNQGFSQLCCLIGDHRTEPPTAAALTALTRLLAALADRYGIDTARGAATTFISRGSNRWAEGEPVTTSTIAGHRDMSRTECPGDACYALIRGPITERVNEFRQAGATVAAEATPISATPVLPVPPAEGGGAAPSQAAGGTSSVDAALPLMVGGSTVAALAAGGLLWWRRRPRRSGAMTAAAEAPPQPRRPRWEAAHAVGPNATAAGTTVVDLVAQGPMALVGLLAVASTAAQDVVRATAEQAAQAACQQLDAEVDALEVVTQLIATVGRALNTEALRPVAAVVALPERTVVATTGPDTAVVLTTDGGIYRPRVSRSPSPDALARASLDSGEVGAVVLGLPPAGHLPDLARDAITWPSVQLGVRNYVQSRARGSAVVVCVNRSALRQRVRAALADGVTLVDKDGSGRFRR